MAPTVASLLSIYASSIGDISSSSKQITRVLLMEDKERKNDLADDEVILKNCKQISSEMSIFSWMTYWLSLTI